MDRTRVQSRALRICITIPLNFQLWGSAWGRLRVIVWCRGGGWSIRMLDKLRFVSINHPWIMCYPLARLGSYYVFLFAIMQIRWPIRLKFSMRKLCNKIEKKLCDSASLWQFLWQNDLGFISLLMFQKFNIIELNESRVKFKKMGTTNF